jgi:hypothetical protein
MQNGSLIETKRRSGASVWEFRWRDRTSGKAVYRQYRVGTTEQFTTEVEAREIVEGIVLEINSDDPRLRSRGLTMSQLIEHYRRRELSVDNTWKLHATKIGIRELFEAVDRSEVGYVSTHRDKADRG